MSEVGIVAPLGVAVVLGFLYLHRQGTRAASLWAWCWASLYASALLATTAGDRTALWMLGDVVSTLFLGFLLAGAMVLGGGREVTRPGHRVTVSCAGTGSAGAPGLRAGRTASRPPGSAA